MALIIKCNDVILPAPTTLTTADEIIWSSNTGRSTVSAKMLGDVIAEKKTFSVGWQWLTSAERKIITDNLKSGFNPISFIFDNETITLTAYRGTINSEYAGNIGDGKEYYRTITCDVIEQ